MRRGVGHPCFLIAAFMQSQKVPKEAHVGLERSVWSSFQCIFNLLGADGNIILIYYN